ncbi:MAG: hypothetical protein IK111_06055 [Lachnospiraceae bacterium]|nr:hypothetical protein [Lachnospiraceae bacterium]
MRITNGIINNNTKSNIILNKEYSDKYNTMVATGQKITRPSDDPIIAIRALRLNNNISEINQYHGKNIPDAQAWLDITQTALEQTAGVLDDVKKYLTQGASDDNTAEDRKNILENLKALKDQIYSSGNADYAGRTVFTGYRTGESLTFTANETKLYTMIQNFTSDDFETMNYISGSYDKDVKDIGQYVSTDDNQTNVKNNEVARLRLAYDNLTDSQLKINEDGTTGALSQNFVIKDKAGNTIYTAATFSVEKLGTNQKANDDLYTKIGDDEVRLITTTGELILGKNVAAQMRKEGSNASLEYSKKEWNKNDPRPEHYFAAQSYDADASRLVRYNYSEDETKAVTDPDRFYADFKDQKIQYEIAYNQKIEINVNADEVYKTSIARDVDELLKVTQSTQDAYDKLKKVEELEKSGSITNPADVKKLAELKDAVRKEYDLYNEKMQNMFSHAITIFDGYSNELNNKIAAMGSLDARLELTRSRVSDQLENFKELADENINVELTESAIDLKNAELALEAAQQAAAKVAKASLLNYL